MRKSGGLPLLRCNRLILLLHPHLRRTNNPRRDKVIRGSLREKIKADEQARNTETQKAFTASYRDEAYKANVTEAERLVTQYLGTRKLDPESRNLALKNTISLANELLLDGKSFPDFTKQRDLLFQRGDKAARRRHAQ